MGPVRYLFLIPVWISAIRSVGVPRFLSSALISSNLCIPRSSPLSAVSSLDLTEHPDKADKLSDGFLSHLEEPTPENPDHSGECLPSIVPALLQITPSVHSQALVWPEKTWACCPGALSPLSQDYYDKYWVDVCYTVIPSQNRMQFPPTISLKNSQCFTQERSMISHVY
jgi:hypothetical protein